jgi:hypothetical protein
MRRLIPETFLFFAFRLIVIFYHELAERDTV